MKIILQRKNEDGTVAEPQNAVIDVDGIDVELQEVFNGVGIPTDQGYFGIAMRDDGIEVMLNGDLVWSSTTALGNATPCLHPEKGVRRRQVGRRVHRQCGRCGANLDGGTP